MFIYWLDIIEIDKENIFLFMRGLEDSYILKVMNIFVGFDFVFEMFFLM